MTLTQIILAAVVAASCILSAGCGNSNNSSTVDNSSNISDTAGTESNADNSENNSSAAGTGVVKNNADGNVNFEVKKGDTIAEITVEGYGTMKAKLFPEAAPVGVENFIKLADSGYFSGKTIHRVMKDFMLQGGSLNGDGTGGDAADGGDFGTEINDNARHFYGALCYANFMGRNTTQFYIVNNKQEQDISKVKTENILASAEQYKAYRDMFEKDTMEYSYYNSMVVYYTNLAEMLGTASDEVIDLYKAGGTPTLDGGYTVFGQVFEGLDVVDAISACEVTASACEVTANAQEELSKPVQTITITSVKISTYEG